MRRLQRSSLLHLPLLRCHGHSHDGVPCNHDHSHSRRQQPTHGHAHADGTWCTQDHGQRGNGNNGGGSGGGGLFGTFTGSALNLFGGGCGHSHGAGGHGHSHGSLLDEKLHGEALAMCKRATAVGAATNAFLCVSKLGLGTAGNSVALVADGLHALVDIISDAVSYGAVTLSTKKFPRCRFPFGVGRVETIGSTIVASILFFGGLSLLWSAIGRIMDHLMLSDAEKAKKKNHEDHSNHARCSGDHHGHSHQGLGHSHVELTAIDAASGQELIVWSMVALCVASIVAKELLFRWTKRVGQRAGSRVVVANAYHHRADAWSAGVALVGVGGMSVGLPLSDAIAGTVVACTILNIGGNLLVSSILELFDYQQADTVEGLNTAVRGVTDRLPIINVFGIRHGHAFILHATLVVAPFTSAAACAAMRDELLASASSAIRVSEVFLSLLVVDRGDPRSLTQALNTVVEFHCAGTMAVEPVVDLAAQTVYLDDQYVLDEAEEKDGEDMTTDRNTPSPSPSAGGEGSSSTSRSSGAVGKADCCRKDIAVVAATCGLRCRRMSQRPAATQPT